MNRVRSLTGKPLFAALFAGATMAAGCATTPPEEWVCDAEGPCYRVAAAPYRPYYGTSYGWFGGAFGFGYWSRPYYYGAPAASGTTPSPAPDASRGIAQPPTRKSTPGRVQPFNRSRPAR